jgi:hypothetical protein
MESALGGDTVLQGIKVEIDAVSRQPLRIERLNLTQKETE